MEKKLNEKQIKSWKQTHKKNLTPSKSPKGNKKIVPITLSDNEMTDVEKCFFHKVTLKVKNFLKESQ